MTVIAWRFWFGPMLALLSLAAPVCAQPSADLPRYDVDVVLDTSNRLVQVRQLVTFTNRSALPIRELVFNAHAHYSVPEKDIGFLAKTAELLRMSPKESMNLDGPVLRMAGVRLLHGKGGDGALAHYFPADNATALTVSLPMEVAPGSAVSVELNFHLKLPAKKGRWGQWAGITTLAQWLPVLAVHEQGRWQPTPFIPWHQPFYNEAGHYRVKVRLPSDQQLAASAAVRKESPCKEGWKEIEFEPICVRDFALVASSRFQEWTAKADGVTIRCLAPAEHAVHAQSLVEAAVEALPIYNKWFGRYPYPQLTIVEGSLGWAGNECGGLVIIDDRIFNMPTIAKKYPIYLLQHELAHQWWYNVVGTNGYAETWMDEGFATYFSHRLADRTVGKNNQLLDYPAGLRWLPNIHRDDFRNFGMIGAWARGQAHPVVQEMPKYEHLANLTAATYDRGSKVVGLLEQRLGEPGFEAFMRGIYRKYQFRILRVADFQKELEEYTKHSWDDFFRHWVYGTGQCDWAIERVEINERMPSVFRRKQSSAADPVRVSVYLKQQGDFNEPTTLGFRLVDGNDYQIRIPIHPDAPVMQIDELHAFVTCISDETGGKQRASVKVEITLPHEPLQISVDPDHILLDARPTNNHWKRQFRWRLTPFYTMLDEVDVTNAHDRWNINAGTWLYFASYNDPWYTKSLMGGLRAGVFRTQEINAGAFLAYRTNDRNIIAGADLLWDHMLHPNVQFGMSLEKSLATVSNADIPCNRGVIFGRYVLMQGSALYLPPFEYVELFGVMQNRCLPDPKVPTPGADLFRDRTAAGLHYHKNLMTPYWDAEGGYSVDFTYQYGLPIFGNNHDFQQVYGQVAMVKGLGKINDWFGHGPMRNWLADTRLAFRLGGAAAVPDNGQFFALGGGDNFRGFDLHERQGNMLWIGSVEWRVPIMTNTQWDFVDHVGGVRNVYVAPFYDVGNAYLNSQPMGNIAHAVGAGLRVDVTWLGLIELTTLRFDIAKTVNGNYPVQFWFGIQHPF
ncbi:MAG: BamA/TamA family outer membrane protein [Planctomycetes bacterium]|nr:BamA/TamA family outer membrane protein [Planctomycetota bacterium]